MVEAGAQVVAASRKIEPHDDGKLFAVPAHTGREEDCKQLVEKAVARFGKVDVLVNNAATNPYFGPLMQVDMAAWDKTFETNLKGYFWMAREVAKHFVSRNAPGSIVSIASIVAIEAAPLQGVYAMTKASIVSMTKTLAVELAPSNIRVNAIAPGFVKTKFAGAILNDDMLRDHVIKKTPMGRAGEPDEIAGGAVYLASDSASFLTGHTLVIDGGLTIT